MPAVEFETLEMLRGLANLVLMTAFLMVAQTVKDPGLGGHERTANMTFVFWWMATAGLMAVRATRNFAVAFWRPELAIFVVETQLAILIGAFALACLTFYFAYLFTGEPRTWIPIALFYSLYAVFLLYLVADQRPSGLELQGWRMQTTYAAPHDELGDGRSAVLLFVPPILGTVGYLSLYRIVPTRLQRLRIVFVATGLLLWLSSYLLSYVLQLDVTFEWTITERVVGIVAALLIVLGYHTPVRWKQRLEAPP